jgi:hypothetical protein
MIRKLIKRSDQKVEGRFYMLLFHNCDQSRFHLNAIIVQISTVKHEEKYFLHGPSEKQRETTTSEMLKYTAKMAANTLKVRRFLHP